MLLHIYVCDGSCILLERVYLCVFYIFVCVSGGDASGGAGENITILVVVVVIIVILVVVIAVLVVGVVVRHRKKTGGMAFYHRPNSQAKDYWFEVEENVVRGCCILETVATACLPPYMYCSLVHDSGSCLFFTTSIKIFAIHIS